ncbi:MAG: hypothetical protein HXY43_04420 [Fischerella sp.]|jgi:hypothetical protein|uniref:hypothetical protein n=1 Tax=Fischerella sp. TaxID=1191 RepID=UPI00179D1EFF|nr:hypothetical protein [Fischerella sp.]NWF58559.1 hypothetical protein [Fischerella sp.]
MEHWQFLIQKQGDRSWQPLESPNIAILEGKYRVVARSNLVNTDVEVRITHSSILELPPKRRIHKRSRRTNAEGLMAVIPFTYLKPGMWELQCFGDLMSDLLGKSWQYSVQLQVLPQERDWEMGRMGDRESKHTITEASLVTTALVESAIVKQNNGSATVLVTEKEEDAIINQPVSPVWLTAETAEQILQHLVDLALPSSESLLENEKVKVEDTQPVIPELPLLLTLDEENYITHWGQTLSINGCVQPRETTHLPRLYTGELRIELRSPQGLEILTQVQQSLLEKILPFSIKYPIEIPADCESQLILGDISLYGTLTTAGEAILLASQSFTITADITQLLAISAAANENKREELDLQDNSNEPPTPEPFVKLDLELFNIVKSKKIAQSLLVHPTSKSLPPLLSFSHKSAERSPQLPKLPQLNNQINTAAVASEPSTHLQHSDQENTRITVELATMDTTAIVVSETPTKLQRLHKEVSFAIVKRRARTGTTFPFLRRLKASPSDRPEVNAEALKALDLHIPENSQPTDLKTVANDDAPELVTTDKAQYSDDSFDDSVAVVVPRSLELSTAQTSYTSPLIRKWMHNHGYSLPEPIDVEYEDYDTYVPASEGVSEEQEPLIISTETASSIANLSLIPDWETEPKEDNEDSEDNQDNEGKESSPLLSLLPSPTPPIASPSNELLSVQQTKTLPAWLAKEIVVDDTDSQEEASAHSSNSSQQESFSSALAPEIIEALPTPQLYVPEGELISGKSVKVRALLDGIRPDIAIKLWVEDCQTRRLLDGPRLFTNLLPNSTGGLEAIAKIHIPLGCLEIRLEAIAVDMETQQESHKVTVVRTVIPEDLANLQLDEMLGI